MKNYKLILLYLIIIILLLAGINLPGRQIEGIASEPGGVYRITISGELDPGIASLVERGIREAEAADAKHIIFVINTYGGLVDSSIRIKDLIMNTPLETTTYVEGRAFSGGALVALGGDNLIMQEGSSIGAAETIPRDEKYISALRTEFRSTAERKNRDGELAAAMVDADLEIPGIIERGKILSLTAREAREQGIADFVLADFPAVLNQLSFGQEEVNEILPSSPERMARFVTRPGISAFLLTLGFLGLILEIMVPGWGVGGTTGVLSLGLFFTGHMIHGYAGAGMIVLLLVGVFLLALELFVIPGFGITGIGGVVAILASVYFVFPSAETALTVISIALVATLVGAFILLRIFGVSRFWKRMSMDYSETPDEGYTASQSKAELLGERGQTITPLRPAGITEINGERMDVVTEGGMIDRDQEVEVVKIEGRRIVVKKIKKESE